MQDLWGSDEPVLKFFTRQCPRLYELDTIAYWIVEKNAHSEKFRAQINHITQVVIDLSIVNGACGLTIFKSENRFSKDVLKPHKYEVVDSSISFMSGAGADAPNIGHKIRAIRQKKEISQAQLAEQIGVTPSTISQFESNTISLSLQALLKLSRALNVSIGDILEEKQGISSDFLFRAKSYSGRKASDSLYKGVSLAPVSLNNGESKMEAYMMSVLPGTRIERHFFADKREEFAYLLSGQIEIEMKKRRYILKEGDSLHLTAEVPDKWENNSDKAVRILWVVGK
jgi:transcriptional regulator with XRE-family HTH domain